MNHLHALEQLLEIPDLPSLGPEPRASRKSISQLDIELNPIFRASKLDTTAQRLIRALLLLWHDHLDESHKISQEIHTADGSFVHGIMHRREPDFWNSKYWFDRVGQHPACPAIAEAVTNYLQKSSDTALASKLIPRGKWNPNAMVDACESASNQPASSLYKTLQQIQKLETRALLEYFSR